MYYCIMSLIIYVAFILYVLKCLFRFNRSINMEYILYTLYVDNFSKSIKIYVVTNKVRIIMGKILTHLDIIQNVK